jgi:hypothetical protein
MRPFHPRWTAPARQLSHLAAALLAALLASAPAAAGDGVPAPQPVPSKSKGVVMAAPLEASDTLRYDAAGTARAVIEVPAPRPRPLPPLLLDPADFGFGASVYFDRVPTAKDLGDLGYLLSVNHIVISLDAWPEGYEAVLPLDQAVLPEGADLIVILPGYPPSHAAAEAWNYLRVPLRIVLLVNGPPANRAGIDELNRMRGLERLVADMEYPSRSGFERLQRPLSFRVVRR